MMACKQHGLFKYLNLPGGSEENHKKKKKSDRVARLGLIFEPGTSKTSHNVSDLLHNWVE
jgi:hypothetical protein